MGCRNSVNPLKLYICIYVLLYYYIYVYVCPLKDSPKGQISFVNELMNKQNRYLCFASEIMNEYWIQSVEQQ